MSTIEKVHRAQEARRAKRNRGSSRGHKPYTDEEKAQKRAEHAELLDAALADVATPEGAVEWLRSRAYNPTLSPANVALAAYQLPGEMVVTMAAIKNMGGRVNPRDAIRLAQAVDLAYREFGVSVKSFRAAVSAAGYREEKAA